MPQTKKLSFVARFAFVSGGIATLTLVGFLLWAAFTAPLNSRMPVPSPDGNFFAYFHAVDTRDDSEPGGTELIVSKPRGELLARLRTLPGRIFWSNANHLAVLEEASSHVTLIANADERLVVVTRIPLSAGAEPRWAPDGNKLACIRTTDSGLQLAMYDIQQPQAFPVPLPTDFRLNAPRLISWSPGSGELYFLNVEGKEAVLEVVDVRTGSVRTLARGLPSVGPELPILLSPDGSKVFLPQPQNSVIDAETGAPLWTLPPKARALWRPWSADSRDLYYVRQEDTSEVRAHNVAASADQTVASGVGSNGFFAADGRAYFFRESAQFPVNRGQGLSERERVTYSWGWYQVDRFAPTAQPLGRLELWPWGQTLDGMILARRDDFTRVRIGLYDPDTRNLDPYVFPTDQADFRAQIRSYRLALTTVVLFLFLAALALAKRGEDKSARSLYIVSLLVTALVCGNLIGDSVPSGGARSPYPTPAEELAGLGWWISSSLPQLAFERVRLTVASLWALMPLATLHFILSFPERTRFLQGKKLVKKALYAAAFLPALAAILGRFQPVVSEHSLRILLVISGGVVAVLLAFSITANLRFAPDKQSRERMRWLIAGLGVAGVGSIAFLIARQWEPKIAGEGWHEFMHGLHSMLFVLAGWAAASAVTYAVVARKPTSVRRFLIRFSRQVLMGVPALMVFAAAWAGAGLVVSGTLWAFSPLAIIVAVLLAVIAVLPFRGRLRVAIDRTLDRARFESCQKLSTRARSLPHTVDRETVAARLEEMLVQTMTVRRVLLFVFDRESRKLRLQPGRAGVSSEVRKVEFDLSEPLCELLTRRDRPLEPTLASADEALNAVMASAGDRLSKLMAEVVLALRRNELVGLLILGPKASGDLYDSEELESLRAVGREAAAAIENIELFEAAARNREMRRQLEDASEIQAKLLPASVPRLNTAQLAGYCFPARSTSGDYYDFLEFPGSKVGLAMSDVAGRGMPAALLMASVESVLHAHASAAPDLADLVQKINRQLLLTSPEPKLCTLFYGVYDDASRRLEYVNAGHSPPLLLSAEGARFLDSTGLPLGLFPEITHQVRSVTLEPGTFLLIYSDGVTEARNPRGDLFGRDRLASTLVRERESDADHALARVVTEIRDFEGDSTLEDDQTLLLLKATE